MAEVGAQVATVVVCDDDKVARAAISAVCEEAGLHVVAETDRGSDAVELMRRFGVDLLVLDLSLSDGSGEVSLAALGQEGLGAAVVVFSAYAGDPTRLLRLGAREVIEKPDFDRLGSVLADLGSDRQPAAPDDRRIASHPVEPAPAVWRSPAGVSSHNDLAQSMLTLEIGDAVVAVTVVGLEALAADVGSLLADDCRLAVAGTLRDELRVQDLLHEAPEIDGFVALLRGGDARSAGAVWSRLSSALRGSGIPGEIRGAGSRVDAVGGRDAVARAIGALQGATLANPAFVSA
jgi:CheY-like chemotaxis protein